MHIFMFHSDLETLKNLHDGVLKSISLKYTTNKSRNFPVEFYGEYVHEDNHGVITWAAWFQRKGLKIPRRKGLVRIPRNHFRRGLIFWDWTLFNLAGARFQEFLNLVLANNSWGKAPGKKRVFTYWNQLLRLEVFPPGVNWRLIIGSL